MLRSSDLQQIFSHTSALEKIQNIKQQHPDMGHRQFLLQLKEEDERNKREVRKSEKTNETEIKDEERDKRERKDKKRAKSAEEENMNQELTEKPPEIGQGRIVDIVV